MIESRPLRVCILSEFFYPDNGSGTGKAVADIARRLVDEHGHQVDVLCGNRMYIDGARLPRTENWTGIKVQRINYPDWNRSGVVKRSICNVILSIKVGLKLLVSPKYDAILVTTAPPFMPLAARLVNIFKRTPYAYLLYDLEPDRALRLGAVTERALPTRLLSKAQRSWLHNSSRVIAIGRCMKTLVERQYSISPEKVQVIPVGADECPMKHFPYQPIAGDERRRFRTVYSGNLGRYHDFDSLLECAKILGPENYEFIIVGRGARRPHVDKRIEEEEIDNVTTRDFQSQADYDALLASADACFVTMEKGIEGTCVPSKFYSIMAAGRVTLASASAESEIAYALKEHDCGIQVAPGSVSELVGALRSLSTDGNRTQQMANNARQAFLRRFTTRSSVDHLSQLLENLALDPTQASREAKLEDGALMSLKAPTEKHN